MKRAAWFVLGFLVALIVMARSEATAPVPFANLDVKVRASTSSYNMRFFGGL